MVQKHEITVKKTARYLTLGEDSDEIKAVWIVLHGYAYLAEYFIKYFEVLLAHPVLVVAPEGLNKFYKNGMDGDVGASWMTKADRLNEIKDYIDYLNSLYEKMFLNRDRELVQVNILGFSQGASTACRWVTEGNVKVDNLVIWSGGIPYDLNFDRFKKVLSGKPLQIVIGDDDDFIKGSDIKSHLSFLKERNIGYNLIRFSGGHKIDPETLQEVAGEL